jgi:hypothetical protein
MTLIVLIYTDKICIICIPFSYYKFNNHHFKISCTLMTLIILICTDKTCDYLLNLRHLRSCFLHIINFYFSTGQ